MYEARSENIRRCRDYCEQLWSLFYPYADAEFKTEFPVRLHQRFWEMYLTVTLLDAGHEVCAPKPGPDIGIKHQGKRIWIEAVATTPGEPGKPDSVPQTNPKTDERFKVSKPPQEQIVLRLTTAISGKFSLCSERQNNKHKSQYQRHLEDKIISPEDCYIVAVNYAKVWDYSDEGTPPYLLQALLGLGSPFVDMNRETGKITREGISYRGSIPKWNKNKVETNLFWNEKSKLLSAVIGSVSHTGNAVNSTKPTLYGQDFMLVHNPMAQNPLPSGLLIRGRSVQQVSVDRDRDIFQVSTLRTQTDRD